MACMIVKWPSVASAPVRRLRNNINHGWRNFLFMQHRAYLLAKDWEHTHNEHNQTAQYFYALKHPTISSHTEAYICATRPRSRKAAYHWHTASINWIGYQTLQTPPCYFCLLACRIGKTLDFLPEITAIKHKYHQYKQWRGCCSNCTVREEDRHHTKPETLEPLRDHQLPHKNDCKTAQEHTSYDKTLISRDRCCICDTYTHKLTKVREVNTHPNAFSWKSDSKCIKFSHLWTKEVVMDSIRLISRLLWRNICVNL